MRFGSARIQAIGWLLSSGRGIRPGNFLLDSSASTGGGGYSRFWNSRTRVKRQGYQRAHATVPVALLLWGLDHRLGRLLFVLALHGAAKTTYSVAQSLTEFPNLFWPENQQSDSQNHQQLGQT